MIKLIKYHRRLWSSSSAQSHKAGRAVQFDADTHTHRDRAKDAQPAESEDEAKRETEKISGHLGPGELTELTELKT